MRIARNAFLMIGLIGSSCLHPATVAVSQDLPLPLPQFGNRLPPDIDPPIYQDRDYRARLQAVARCWLAWMDHTCALTAEQREKLEAQADGHVDRESERLADLNPNRSPILNDLFPVHFPLHTTSRFLDGFVSPEQLGDILSAEQQQAWTIAVETRRKNRQSAFADAVVSTIDRSLFLTSAQREQFRDRLLTRPERLHTPSYSLARIKSTWAYMFVDDLTGDTQALELLSDHQRRAWDILRTRIEGISQIRITLDLSASLDTRNALIEETFRTARNEVFPFVEARLDWFAAEAQLSDEQLRALRTASRGAATALEQDRGARIRTAMNAIDMRDVRPNFGRLETRDAGISLNDFAQHPLWTNALRSLDDELREPLRQREEANFQTRCRTLLDMLDLELWLRPDQRGPLLELVTSSQPLSEAILQDRPGDREPYWLAHVFRRIDVEKLATILDPAQQAQWNRLSDSFTNDGDNVTVLLQSGTRLILPLAPLPAEGSPSGENVLRAPQE